MEVADSPAVSPVSPLALTQTFERHCRPGSQAPFGVHGHSSVPTGHSPEKSDRQAPNSPTSADTTSHTWRPSIMSPDHNNDGECLAPIITIKAWTKAGGCPRPLLIARGRESRLGGSRHAGEPPMQVHGPILSCSRVLGADRQAYQPDHARPHLAIRPRYRSLARANRASSQSPGPSPEPERSFRPAFSESQGPTLLWRPATVRADTRSSDASS